MSQNALERPRAFAIRWKDLERWTPPKNLIFAGAIPAGWSVVKVGEVVRQCTERVKVEDDEEYKLLGVRWYAEGVFHRETVKGRHSSATHLYPARPQAFIYNRLFAWKQSFAVVPSKFDGCYVSSEFPQFEVDDSRVLVEYLYLLFVTDRATRAVDQASSGSAAVSRNRFKEEEFVDFEIALPPLPVQKAIVARWQRAQDEERAAQERIAEHEKAMEEQFLADVGLKPATQRTRLKNFILRWAELERWDVLSAQSFRKNFASTKYPTVSLGDVVQPLALTNKRLTPADFPQQMFNYIGMENVEAVSGRLVGFEPVRGKEIKSASVVFDAEHILYGKLRPYLRKVLRPTQFGLDEGVASSEFVALKPKSMIRADFLHEVLRSSSVAQQAQRAIGARMPRVSIEDLLGFQIPLPPNDERNNVQELTMQRVEESRAEIARESEAATRAAREAKVEIEALILGTKKIEETV